MSRLTVLLCVAVVTVACCECAIVRDEASPLVETDLELTAADSDAGNWTANLGDIEVQIEHRHGDTIAKEGGSWTLDVTRKLYEKQNEEIGKDILVKQKIEELETKEELPQEETEDKGDDEHAVVSLSAYEPHDMKNEITNNGSFGTEIQFPAVTEYSVFEDRLPETAVDYNENYYAHGAVILDPDNFEYFKGVGWFKLDNRGLNWADARGACTQFGAHLAVLDTQERVRVFLTLLQRPSDIPASSILRQEVYIGVSDPDRNRQFTTVRGKTLVPGFPIWFDNEPDNAPPREYCPTFHVEGRARDVPCFYLLPFICEKDIPAVIY